MAAPLSIFSSSRLIAVLMSIRSVLPVLPTPDLSASTQNVVMDSTVFSALATVTAYAKVGNILARRACLSSSLSTPALLPRFWSSSKYGSNFWSSFCLYAQKLPHVCQRRLSLRNLLRKASLNWSKSPCVRLGMLSYQVRAKSFSRYCKAPTNSADVIWFKRNQLSNSCRKSSAESSAKPENGLGTNAAPVNAIRPRDGTGSLLLVVVVRRPA